MRGVLDTSVLIAREQSRAIDESKLPDEVAICVVTLAELELGVHNATDDHVRAMRMATLHAARETYVALPIDSQVASAFAELVISAKREGKRPKVQDAWIAATAIANDAAVVTQDDDYAGLPGVKVVSV